MRCFDSARKRTLAPVFLLVLSSAARADVPVSAQSISLAMEPLLLDHANLIFELPQRGAGSPSIAMAQVADGSDAELGLGLILASGPIRYFTLSSPDLAGAVDGFFSGSGSDSRVFQVGLAGGGRAVRAGASVRASTGKAESRDTRTRPGQDSDDHWEVQSRWAEGALGVGLGRNFSLDAAIAVARAEIEGNNSFRREEDLAVESLEADPKTWWTATLRSRIPAAGGEIVAAGRYGTRDRSWITRWDDGSSPQEGRLERSGESWLAALSYQRPSETLDWLAFSLSHEELTWMGVTARSGLQVERETTRVSAFSISGREKIWRELEGQFGLRKAYARYRDNILVVRTSTESRTELWEYSEELEDRFSWGLVAPWKRFVLAGSVDTTLDLENVLVALDLQVAL